MICKKKSLLVLSLSALFLGFFIFSRNVSASSLGTSSFDLRYRPNSGSSYVWRNNILYGNNNPTVIDASGSIIQYQFNTSSVQAGGNYATIHFETNIVSTRPVVGSYNFEPWVNLAQQNIIVCNASPRGPTIIQKNLSYATTPWQNSSLYHNNTLTFYGDVVMGEFTPNTNYSFICMIGSSDYSFYNYTAGSTQIWFEQNPMSIEWTNDRSNALMQTQINQNNTIIQQNQATYDYLTDNTAPNADTSVLGSSAGWLPPGPVDSILTLPVQLAQGILNVFTGTNTCAPINVPLGIIDYTLQIPCMSPYFDIAQVNIVWNVVGAIISAFLIYNTLKWLYKFVDDTLTLRENNSTMWGGL